MTALEISLLIMGIIAFIASFVVPEMRSSENIPSTLDEETVKKLVGDQVEEARTKIEGVVEETVEYAVEKTERSLDRLSNEKIMAVNEYSDTVLEEINKNHKEVLFLYDMLSDKQVDLKNTVRKAEQTKKDTKEIVQAAEVKMAASESRPVSALERLSRGTITQEELNPQRKVKAKTPVTVEETRFDEGLNARKVHVNEARVVEPVEQEAMQVSYEEEKAGNKNERILGLHKEGKSNVAIAKELGLGVGEVKLVIDLFEGAGV